MSAAEATGAAAPPPGGQNSGATEKDLSDKLQILEAAITDAEGGAITNARKLEALTALDRLIPRMSRPELLRHQPRLHDLLERLVSQNATEPLRRLVVSLLGGLCQGGDASSLPTLAAKLLRLAGEQGRRLPSDARVAALDVVGGLAAQHGRLLEHLANDVFVHVAKHMKLPEASARCSAFQCLCRTISAVGIRSTSTANNIWKMLQKMLLDKAVTVRTATAHALAALVLDSPACVGGASSNGEAMTIACLKALAAEDQAPGASASECRFAFATALAQVLAAMAMPVPPVPGDRAKRKPAVTDFASAIEFLEQAVAKGPSSGQALVGFRAAMCLVSVRLAEAMHVEDGASVSMLVRSLLNLLDLPSQGKTRGSSNAGGSVEDESLAQVARYLGAALRHVLRLADRAGCLLDVMEQGLLPLVSAQVHEASRSADMRMVVVLETLCCACVTAGEGFCSIEAKVSKPLLHLVGNHSNPLVQLHATYALRVIAHASPPQLFQLMSVLLNLATVQNAELLGTPVPRRRDSAGGSGTGGQGGAAGPNHVSADLQPLLRGLFGHCTALAALNGELFHSSLGVPHDVTSAVLGTSRALLQPHPNTTVSAQRRSCAFLLLEGLMCLGTDWVGQRLTTLFALWKTALGKKPVDRAKVFYQQHVAATPVSDGGGSANAEAGSGACRDELLSLLCALRSLYAFTLHSHETLLTSYSHLHKILVVFLTNISQLVVALPHPTSPSFRAKYRSGGDLTSVSCSAKAIITLSTRCEIPDILLLIRSTMYRTFAAMLPTQYSSRFVPLLNMLADDVTRALPADFPTAEFLGHFLHPEDAALDLVDPHTESSRDGAGTIRAAVAGLLSAPPATAAGKRVATWGRAPCGGALPTDVFGDETAAGFFSGAPREGPAGIEGLLTPWDAWFDPSRPLVEQCVSAEWEWRCSAVSLLAIIMNASEVSEAPRSAVLLHLVKRKESGEEGGAGGASNSAHSSKRSTPAPQGDGGVVPCLAVLAYLREHVRIRGVKCAPPASAMEQVLQLSLDGLRDANPVVRRLHVELLAALFYAHHQLSESTVVPTIMQYITGENPAEGTAMRSAMALLCGVVLRTFAWDSQQQQQRQQQQQQQQSSRVKGVGVVPQCPYFLDVTPALLKLAKETSQPVRLWMLHAIHLSMQAAGLAFAPLLKDALRLATAHLLADFFEAPLVLWVVAELVHSAASLHLQAGRGAGGPPGDEHVARMLGIWNELKHVRYVGPGSGSGISFAIVRTEVLCISTANSLVRLLAPTAPSHCRDISELVSARLAPQRSGGSVSCAVRTAAARCLADLVASGLDVVQSTAVMQEPSQLFALLEDAEEMPESQALQDLIRALIRQRGLRHLPTWLQSLKEIVLALSPKSKNASGKEDLATPAREESARDEHDDGASMAGPQREEAGADERRHRTPRSASKVFAVSCVQVLLEQADPEDAAHFQSDAPSSGASAVGSAEHRLVQHLETMVTLAAHASSSDEESLVAAGLRLMLLIVQRFRNTRDVQGQTESENWPLLLVQFEAHVTTCIRHNSRPETNPGVLALALELLRDVIVAQACNSKQRLITLLLQPFGSSVFEPDPMFCECASTKTFLVRLRGACEILDGTPDDQQALGPRLRDLARWIELALRDSAVLLAGLPLQSIKTYQPVCFSLADYKVVQPCFRAAFPSILRGACALCDERRPSTLQSAPDLIALALGVILLLLGDQSGAASEAEMRVFLRTIRQFLLHCASLGGSAAISPGYFSDLMTCIWQHVFQIPTRCRALLPELVELLHSLSAVLWRRRRAGADARAVTTVDTTEMAAGGEAQGIGWLEGLCAETEEGERRRSALGGCCFHVAAAALRCPAVVEDAVRTSQALEIFVWWLSDALPKSLESSRSSMREREDEIVAAALGEESSPDMQDNIATGLHCSWLWMLFLSPFPADLMRAQPTVTQKYWKMVCTILGAAPTSEQGVTCAANQLLYLALIANKLCKSFLGLLEEGGGELSPTGERNVVYASALLMPVVSSLCTVLQRASASAPGDWLLQHAAGGSRAAVSKCLAQVKEVFARGLEHSSAKVVQTVVSSMQSVLQNPACGVLCPIIMPCLILALVKDSPGLPQAAVGAAWGVMSTVIAGKQDTGTPNSLAEATTSMVLRVVLRIADHSTKKPGSTFDPHRAHMAQCLVQAARSDPKGLKAEVSALSQEGQHTIQQLLREHMSSTSRRGTGRDMVTSVAPLSATRIELKLKF